MIEVLDTLLHPLRPKAERPWPRLSKKFFQSHIILEIYKEDLLIFLPEVENPCGILYLYFIASEWYRSELSNHYTNLLKI